MALFTSDRIIEEVRGPSAEGTRVEALREVGFREGCPLPMGEGLCPLPRNVFDFRAQNGEIWCILGAIFRGEIGRCCRRKG